MSQDSIDEGSIGRRCRGLVPQNSAGALAPSDRLQSDLTMRKVFPIIRDAQRIYEPTFCYLNNFLGLVLIRKIGKEPAHLLVKSTLRRLHRYPYLPRPLLFRVRSAMLFFSYGSTPRFTRVRKTALP